MLRFRLFNIPITVRGSFLVIAALIGFVGVGDISQGVAWVGIVFVSILVHELGHAFTARMYGSEVAIELNGIGGLTRWSLPDSGMTPGRRALIAAAGSATGLAFGGVIWVVARQFGPYSPFPAFVLQTLVYVNVFWGLLNWLPIRPLDGGHLLESLLERFAPKHAQRIAKVAFMGTALVALLLAINFRLIFIAILSGWMLLLEFNVGRPPPSDVPAGLPTLSYDPTPEWDNPDAEELEPPETVPPDDR